MDYKLRKGKCINNKILKLETIALIMKINLDTLIQFIKQALIPDGKNKKQIIHLPFFTDGTSRKSTKRESH